MADVVVRDTSNVIERVVIEGDLSRLTPADRIAYYRRVCESIGVNPFTKPFDYIVLNGKLTLYAKRDCTDQLRKLHDLSVTVVSRERIEDIYVVTARGTLPSGRVDESIGAVSLAGLKGDALANAIMKAETKAKRRVTLSIVGLGWLDETEIETIPGARPAQVDSETGEIKGNGDKPTAPTWQGTFFTWLKDVLQTNEMLDGPEAGKRFYEWAKAQGHMREHLGMYAQIGSAQTDCLKAVSAYKIAQAEAAKA